ncbi:MAG: Txe/YoeB family addiction module toxin [Synergistaceae bacterium]|nr:Txe/YoeB family addiction module toxin [Synergistaceae bacterium]MBQ3398492.1 Txe/YoeB family addiction module toxin [Synergistaceae bacterium]MBQ3758417.1 Txe/YoeB family addiction module toxin [Synergistaceae bacterium]MBQ4402777.1 Txe/YoeB family addiction module toxin [Synergistaceae bacterium]MBQ6115463.1 Txe/YoeB family addiction module toxin [Synergistaceae bacterium]
MNYEIRFTKDAQKHVALCRAAGLGRKLDELLDIIRVNPFQVPPPCEKLKGLENTYSRRLNVQHRMVYQVDIAMKRIKIISLWTHYE